MAGGKIETAVAELAEEVGAALGYDIADVSYVKEGQNRVLRIFIDKLGENERISTDDCERFSRSIETLLDEKDFIENSYSLEISSPGLDRPLKKPGDFVRFKGKAVDIKLYKAKNGAKKFTGELIGLENEIITIKDERGGLLEFERAETASVKLAVIF